MRTNFFARVFASEVRRRPRQDILLDNPVRAFTHCFANGALLAQKILSGFASKARDRVPSSRVGDDVPSNVLACHLRQVVECRAQCRSNVRYARRELHICPIHLLSKPREVRGHVVVENVNDGGYGQATVEALVMFCNLSKEVHNFSRSDGRRVY